ncbi:hypothetical protein HPB51_001693 [Rhipicephalus microplus]|uniref:Uncharacterized protein n=1 Tax=Rhipicephalus microplus TaxID=6941 RepID=A0A9J6EVZ2_RHIMP|nr:hypothetical protein HPB51_001693 [Rhipicephalus microplus]
MNASSTHCVCQLKIVKPGPARSRTSHPDAPTPSPEDPGSVVSRTASRHVRSAEASLVSAPEILNPKLFPDIEQPAFDNSTPRNVTTQQMQTVYLHCIVNNLGERTPTVFRRPQQRELAQGVLLHPLTTLHLHAVLASLSQRLPKEKEDQWPLCSFR